MNADQIITEWKNNPEIRAEFQNNIASYAAYVEAEEKGLAKICRAPVVK